MWVARRGQITIIMILVVLLLLIFSVMFYIQRSTQEKTSERQRTALTLSQEKLDPLNEYVTSCLDISAKAALKQMGKQGGYLYKSQRGPVPDFAETDFGVKYIDYDGSKVAYAVLPAKGKIGPWASEPPLYPWKTFPEVHNLSFTNLTNESLLEVTTEGYFGRNIMPNMLRPFTNSIQSQLEHFVENNAEDCLDLGTFETQSMSIVKGEPNVTVSFGENNVVFDLHYPLKVVENLTGAEGQMDTFATRYGVRLKKIIQFMEMTTDKDVTIADFNMSNISGTISGWVETDISRDDDVVFIRDRASKIIGEPYTFMYARKNRPPALGLINSTVNRDRFDIDKFVLCGVFAGGKVRGAKIKIDDNMLVLENQAPACRFDTARIPLQSYDPDEDEVRYVIEVNREETQEYELKEREMGVLFTFAIKAKDASSEDSEILTMKSEVITP